MSGTGKPLRFDLSVLLSCMDIWCYSYLGFVIIFEVITLSFSVFIALIFAIFASYVLLWYFALPTPDNALVTEVLGRDLKLKKINSDLELSSNLPNISAEEEDENYDKNDFISVIGHRGAGLDAPENSLSSFKQCAENGCRSVEVDLVLTADGVPILFHDDTVDRITNSTGLIQQLTWDQLKELDISVKHPLQERFVGERVALFSESVKLCLELDLRMIIDVKDDRPEIINVILNAYRENPDLYKRALLSAFNPFIIYGVRSKDPRIVCSLAWRPYYYSCQAYKEGVGYPPHYHSLPLHLASRAADIVSSWILLNLGYYVLGLSAILLHKDVITWELLKQWQRKNIRVIAWTVNLPAEKAYFSRVMKIAYITDTLAGDSPISI